MCRAKAAEEKRCRVVIQRSQQATKNLHLLETRESRSFASKNEAHDDSIRKTVFFTCPYYRRNNHCKIVTLRGQAAFWSPSGVMRAASLAVSH